MKNNQFIYRSLLYATGQFIYVGVVAWLMFNSHKFIDDSTPNFFIPVFVLMMLVISATVTGVLILGKPIQLFLSGLKKEAVAFLLATLAWLILYLILVILYLNLR